MKQRRRWRQILTAASLLAAAVAVDRLHARLQACPLPAAEAAAVQLSPTAVRLLTLNLSHLDADAYYLRAVAHFGDKSQHAANYPALTPLLAQSVALDPNFAAAYRLVGTALMLTGQGSDVGMQLLRQGCRQLPQVWQLPFYRGFYAYYGRHDFDEAAQSLAQAARLPGAPRYVGPLATRLAAKSTDPAAGLALLDGLLHDTQDDGVRQRLRERRPALVLECRLQALRRAAARFAARTGKAPGTLAALAPDWEDDGEPFAEACQDPFGGSFFVAEGGQVATHHEDQRLPLYGDNDGSGNGNGANAAPPPPEVHP